MSHLRPGILLSVLLLSPSLAGASDGEFDLSVPLPAGGVRRFHAIESSIFGEEFQSAHPELRTYRAVALDDPAITARLDVTPRGIHGLVFTPGGTALVEPGDSGELRSTWLRDAEASAFECDFVDPVTNAPKRSSAPVVAFGSQRRTFRFILMATGEYSQSLGGVPQALAQMTTSMNRIVAILERDVAVRLQVVQMMAFPSAATDPYADLSVGSLLTRNSVVVDSIFGASAWDMTQAIAVTGQYRGVSFRPLDCYTGFRGESAVQGIDATAPQFDIKVMAHEIGHTLGATHSQDGGTNRSAETPFEPSTGWTIMTSPGDPASFGDAFYHVASLAQMDTTLLVPEQPGDVCGVFDPTGDTPPTVDAGPDYTIPQGTPFVLTGNGSDVDAGDVLTYTWEEYDRAPAANDATLGPLFRWRPPTSAPLRAFPALATVLSGVADPLEKLPTVNRTLRFRLVARDNFSGAGGHAWDEKVVTVSGPPFAVTSPNGGETLAAGAPFLVTWSVGGGSVAPAVDLLLSVDGGNGWTPLVTGTTNDGAELVTANLGVTRTACRIKVQAAGNIFYDVSNTDFTIVGDPTEALLSRFECEPIDGGVRIAWQVSPRFERVDVEQAPRPEGPWLVLVPDRGIEGEISPSVAEAIDREEPRDQYFRLVAYEPGGAATTFGPILLPAALASGSLAITSISPQPASGAVRIAYRLPRAGLCRLRILDVQGRVLSTLVDGAQRAGVSQGAWTIDRESGVYFVSLASRGRTVVRRVIVTR